MTKLAYIVTISGDGPKQRVDVSVRRLDPSIVDAFPEHPDVARLRDRCAAREAAVRKVYGPKAEWAPVATDGELGLVFKPFPLRYGGGVEAITEEIRVVVKPRKT